MRKMWRGIETRSCLRMTFPCRLVKGMDRITFIKQEGLKHGPYLGISPVFTEDVRNVLIARDMTELDQFCGKHSRVWNMPPQ